MEPSHVYCLTFTYCIILSLSYTNLMCASLFRFSLALLLLKAVIRRETERPFWLTGYRSVPRLYMNSGESFTNTRCAGTSIPYTRKLFCTIGVYAHAYKTRTKVPHTCTLHMYMLHVHTVLMYKNVQSIAYSSCRSGAYSHRCQHMHALLVILHALIGELTCTKIP